MEERFPGELQTLRADNVRLRRLLALSEEQARAADPDQATLTGAPTAPVDMRSAPEAKLRFYASLFRCRTDVYALRWENRRDGRSGWIPAINGYWRKGTDATVHDYHDELTPVLASSLRKRAPGYTKLGFPDSGRIDSYGGSEPGALEHRTMAPAKALCPAGHLHSGLRPAEWCTSRT